MNSRSFRLRLPAYLIVLRVLLGPIVFLLTENKSSLIYALAALTVAFLSDVFDEILARCLGVVTASLRIADSRADIWFYGWVAASVWITHPVMVREMHIPILAVLILQLLSYLFAWKRYGRIASFHAYTAKLWGIALRLRYQDPRC